MFFVTQSILRSDLLEIITSKDNPLIKLYKKLSESKKERLKSGLFIAEGVRIVEDAILENIKIHSLMVTEQNLQKYSALLSQADLRGVKPVIISNELGNRISCTEKTQGIFVICNVPEQSGLKSSLKENGKYIVLYQLQDPGNIGTIIRTADAMGIDGVILSESCDVYSPKTIRSTMGSIFRISLWHGLDMDNVLEAFKLKNIKIYPAVISENAVSLAECDFSDGACVIIGNEGNGIPENIVKMCDIPLTIKMNGNINSMNASMAAGIILWEMSK